MSKLKEITLDDYDKMNDEILDNDMLNELSDGKGDD